MIRSALLLLSICCYSNLAIGQISILDDIDLGPSYLSVPTTPTNDWGATHGTPDYSPTQIRMWGMYNSMFDGGEGVYRIVNFLPNRSYDLSITIPEFLNPHDDNEFFDVLLANDPIPPNCSYSGCNIPSLTSRVLYTYTGGSFNDKVLRLQFSTDATESWKYLVVYPRAETYEGTAVWMTITCLSIRSTCTGPDVTFCNGQMPSGNTYNNKINIGSSLCSGSAVYSTPLSSTGMTSATIIDIKPKTTLSVNPGKTVVLEINPCTSYVDFVPSNSVYSSLLSGTGPCTIARPIVTTIIKPEGDISIYPNPSNGHFELKVGFDLLNNQATIFSTDGKLLYSFNLTNVVTDVDLTSYYPGLYLLKIQTSKGMITKKLIRK